MKASLDSDIQAKTQDGEASASKEVLSGVEGEVEGRKLFKRTEGHCKDPDIGLQTSKGQTLVGLAGPPGTVGQGLCTTHIVYTGNGVLHSPMKQIRVE